MKLKKGMALLLSLILIVEVFPFAVFSALADSAFSYGDGTENNPYIIANTSDLSTLASNVNSGNKYGGKYFKLSQNFNNATALTTPIGKDINHAFAGTFDGNNKTVILNIDVQASSYFAFAGLFGCNTGNIKNVGVSGSIYASGRYSNDAGGICGYNYKGKIENCYKNGGTITASRGKFNFAGGICSYNYKGKIKNCYKNGGTITASGRYSNDAGGICGYNYKGKIENCHKSGGTITTSGGKFNLAGGICGDNGKGTISNCYSSGSGTIKASGGTIGSTINEAGGICGMNNGNIENCYKSGGTITASGGGKGNSAGGVCGLNNRGTISNCYSSGSGGVKASDGTINEAGGICGMNNGNIENCYKSGLGFVSASGGNYGNEAGGVCGYNKDGGTIANCYNNGSGTIKASGSKFNFAGSVCGHNYQSKITNCYYNSSKSNKGIGNTATDDQTKTNGLTTTKMKSKKKGGLLDLLNTFIDKYNAKLPRNRVKLRKWFIKTDQNNGYPMFSERKAIKGVKTQSKQIIKLFKKSYTIKNKTVRIKAKAKTKLSFKAVKNSKSYKITKNGTINFIKRGTYKIKVRIIAEANNSYKQATTTKVIKVKVK